MTRWYAIGRTVYCQRNGEPHGKDPVVALCCSNAAAEEIAYDHNAASVATRIVPGRRERG